MSRAGVSSALPSTSSTPSPPPAATARRSVDLPVPGGPSSTTWQPLASAAASTSASRRRPTMRSSTAARSARESVLVDDHSADVLAVEQVGVALVDLIERVALGDQLVELEAAGLVHAEQLRDVVHGVAGTEQAALHRLLVQGQDRAGQLHGDLVGVGKAGDHGGAALADRLHRGCDDLLVDDVDGDDRLVGADAAGELLGQLQRLFGGRDAMRRAEILGRFALVGERVDGDDVHRPGVGRALDGIGADAADAVDHHGLPRLDVGGVDGRPPAGGNAAADEDGRLEREIVVDLHARHLGDHRVLAERAEHAHAAVVLAAGVEAVAAVGRELAVEDVGADVAQVLPAGAAPAAVAAARDERADDVIALLHARDTRPDLLDDPGALVTTDQREAGHDVAVAEVLVGVAEPGGDVADQDLVVLRLIEVELDHLPVGPDFGEHGTHGLHEVSSSFDFAIVPSGGALLRARGHPGSGSRAG